MDIYSLIAILTVVLIQVFAFVYLFSQQKKQLVSSYPTITPFVESEEIFVSFACTNCHNSIVLNKRIFPGEVAVLDCDNCQTSWTVYNPQLIIKPTKELPEPIKVGVAENSPMNV